MTAYTVELTDEQARVLLEVWENYDPGESNPECSGKGVIADAIRANPPKPPRIAEPGPWGVVLANRKDWRSAWVRDGGGPWVQMATGVRADWGALGDPQLLREGTL